MEIDNRYPRDSIILGAETFEPLPEVPRDTFGTLADQGRVRIITI